MADRRSATRPQRLHSQPTHQNPSKFYSHFLFRAFLAVVIFIIVPIVPSIAPGFLSQSIFIKSWELLHVVFFGIAVSYGIFSRRCNDSTSETSSKLAVSELLQFPSASQEEDIDDSGNKVQSWSSRYVRKEPVVVVANNQSAGAFDREKTGSISVRDDDQPLFLPVRSLKSRVSDDNGDSRVSERRFRGSSSYARSLKTRASMYDDDDDDDASEMITEPERPIYQSSNSSSDRSEDFAKNDAFYRSMLKMNSSGSADVSDSDSDISRVENETEDLSEEEFENEEDGNGKEEAIDASDSACSSGVEDEGRDVDKKAGEFIARFKEQIRRQRIESIKSSTAPFSGIFVR